jgi:hypothetical protein
MTLDPKTRVWRYMSFAKLVWMLQNKQLWLSSVELLEDKWELVLDTSQLNSIINNRPASLSAEQVIDWTAKVVKARRKQTFVNCWTASQHESHALWRIYCPSSESVAIQTTLGRLKKSVPLPVLEVAYSPYEANGTLPDIQQLATQKRPMFEYEQEVRIILVRDFSDPKHPDSKTVGAGIDWDPERHIETIWVHPEAPFWFMETVTETVRRLAPKLSHGEFPLVAWSKMNSSPPF